MLSLLYVWLFECVLVDSDVILLTIVIVFDKNHECTGVHLLTSLLVVSVYVVQKFQVCRNGVQWGKTYFFCPVINKYMLVCRNVY